MAGFWSRRRASVDDDDDEKEEHGEFVDDHIPDFVDRLHPGKNVVAIADATYLYTQKSLLNYQFQKCTYSVYKGRNLQKEHVVCTPDGFILFSDGPFFADGYNNDQIIWIGQLTTLTTTYVTSFPRSTATATRRRTPS